MKFKNIKRTVATALAIATIGTTAAAVQNAVANPLYAAASTTSFADLPSSHWAYKYVMEAAEKGWVSGTGNGQYNPTGTVSAAEFLSMVTRAFYPGEAEQYPGGAWYQPYFTVANIHDLLRNVDVSSATATRQLNRYEMSAIAAEVLSDKNVDLSNEERIAYQAKIADWSSIPFAYQFSVPYTMALGVLNGVDANGTFAGTRTMDRAQAAVVLCKMDEVLQSYGSTNVEPEPVNPAEPVEPVNPKPVEPVTPEEPVTPPSSGNVVGTISSEKVTYSYDTHKPVVDYWSNQTSEIQAISDKDAYNAAVQSLKDQDKIRYEGEHTKGLKRYNPYYNYAVFNHDGSEKCLNVGDAIIRMSSGAMSLSGVALPSTGNMQGVGAYDAEWSKEYADVLDPILDRMPNGSDKKKAEYMVQQICDRFDYSSGMFTWLSGTSGRCEAYANAVMAIFSRAGIPVINEAETNKMNHSWNLAYLDGEWYVVDATHSDTGGRPAYRTPNEYMETSWPTVGGYPWRDSTKVAMALIEDAFG